MINNKKLSGRDYPLSPTPVPIVPPVGVNRAQRSAINRSSDVSQTGAAELTVDPQRSIINRSKV